MTFTSFTSNEILILTLIVLWTLPWKGVALWRAARNKDVWWFVAMLILNTLAILEIIYIFAFSKNASDEQESGGGER